MAKITPIFKILGKLIYNELYIHLAEKNIFCEQFGSTDHAIIEIVDEIANDFMENKNTIGVFIDLSEAFDTINQ